MKLKSMLGGAIAAIAIIPAFMMSASAQVTSASPFLSNGTPSDQGVTVYYAPDGAGTKTTALAVDDTHANHVGWASASSNIGASWITKELDTYSGTNDPLPQYSKTGTWVYDQSFFVTLAPGATQEALKGLILSDDNVDKILLNGVDVTSYYMAGGAPTWQNPGTFDTSFFGGVVNGLNSLEIQVDNSASFVTGVAYNFSVVPVVPEPSIVLFGLMSSGSLVGLMLRGRMRTNKQI